MKHISYREYLIWQAHFLAEWDEPSKTDFYLMQVAQLICQVNAKKGKRYRLEQFRIRFKEQKRVETEEEKAENLKRLKAAAIARVGGKVVRVTIPKQPNTDNLP